MTSIILAFVGTAVRKSGIRKKFALHPDIELRDVDKILCSLPQTREHLITAGAYQFQDPENIPRLIDVIQRLPRTQVLSLWHTALEDAAAVLGTSDRSFRVLITGVMYHSNRRSEFYSPFDLTALTEELGRRQQLQVERVVMFIDDIYDVYGRLSSDNEIYDRFGSMETEYGRLLDEEEFDPTKFSVAEQVLIATEVQVAQLVTLLHWREMEVTEAERIAASFQVPYLLWAVKQELPALLPWLQRIERTVVYLSHPISRARRHHADTDDWPPFATECNAVQHELAALNVTAVMPTAIDEYRLRKEPAEDTTRPRRRPELTARWPLIGEELLYTPDITGAPDHAHILAPKVFLKRKLASPPKNWGDADLLDGPLRFLERQIAAQVSARDHTLVVHTNHIIVFQPLSAKPHISGGVRAEIDHWSTLAQTEPTRRIVFLHRLSDARAAVESEGDLAGVIALATEELVVEKLDVDEKTAAEVIRDIDSREWDLLDTGAKTPADLAREKLVVHGARKEAPRRALWKILAKYRVEIRGVAEERVGLWVIPDTSPWNDFWPAVMDFLDGGPLSPDAYSDALSLIPVDTSS